jgi:hypothetical protein
MSGDYGQQLPLAWSWIMVGEQLLQPGCNAPLLGIALRIAVYETPLNVVETPLGILNHNIVSHCADNCTDHFDL